MGNRGGDDISLDYVPEDGLREVLEEEERILRTLRKRSVKKPYPSNRDIVEAIRYVLASRFIEHPDEFPDAVIEVLEERGFETRHVTVKRIWRLYETLVRKGVIRDELGVLYY